VLARGGRIDNPAGSELKKRSRWSSKARCCMPPASPSSGPRRRADSFAHAVFRTGFAWAILLPGPEGTQS